MSSIIIDDKNYPSYEANRTAFINRMKKNNNFDFSHSFRMLFHNFSHSFNLEYESNDNLKHVYKYTNFNTNRVIYYIIESGYNFDELATEYNHFSSDKFKYYSIVYEAEFTGREDSKRWVPKRTLKLSKLNDGYIFLYFFNGEEEDLKNVHLNSIYDLSNIVRALDNPLFYKIKDTAYNIVNNYCYIDLLKDNEKIIIEVYTLLLSFYFTFFYNNRFQLNNKEILNAKFFEDTYILDLESKLQNILSCGLYDKFEEDEDIEEKIANTEFYVNSCMEIRDIITNLILELVNYKIEEDNIIPIPISSSSSSSNNKRKEINYIEGINKKRKI